MNTKKLFFFAIAALGLAACSNDEVVEMNQGEAISFRPLTTNVTRSPNSTGVKQNFETGDVINVYANYFNGESNVKYFQDDFTKQDGSTFTSSPAKYYWPAGISSTNKMTFTAIWGATQLANNPGKIGTADAKVTIEGNKDILVARHVSNTAEATPILNFRHALSQVVLKVKNTNTGLKITITDFQVGYVDKTSYFDFDKSSASAATDQQELEADASAGNVTSSPAAVTLIPATNWTNDAAAAPTSNYSQNLASSVVFTATNGGTADDEVVTLGSPWILLPQNRTAISAGYVTTQSGTVNASTVPDINKPYLAVKMTIESYNGAAVTGTLVSQRWCCWPVSIDWSPGYKYTYTINVGDGGYEPIDTDNDGALDPTLGTEIVFSPSCTIDYWVVAAGTDVTM